MKINLTQGKVYVFDKVLKPNVTQTQVYDSTAKSIVKGLSENNFLQTQYSLWWNSQMCSLATMGQSLLMARHQVGKRTPWRESLMIPICRASYQGRWYYWNHTPVYDKIIFIIPMLKWQLYHLIFSFQDCQRHLQPHLFHGGEPWVPHQGLLLWDLLGQMPGSSWP